jgi:hypothetical protein
MAGAVTADLFASPAIGILCALEADGFEVGVRPDGTLRIAPRSKLTTDRMREIAEHRDALRTLVHVCDAGVQDRRATFRRQLDASHPGVLVPALLFRADVPYVRGACFSCGETLEAVRVGRCWRCALAMRLALGVPIRADSPTAVYEETKVVG